MNSLSRVLAVGLLVAAVCFGIYQVGQSFADNLEDATETATYTVQCRTLEDRVVERGTVESQKTVYGKCQIPGRNKITFIIPEGTEVKKGDKVAEFETTEIDNEIKEKEVEVNTAKGTLAEAIEALEIQKNKNKTDVDAAQLEYDLAVIDSKTYKEGTHVAEKADLDRAIKEGEAELEKVSIEKNNIEILVKKGYRTPQQLKEFQLREQVYKNQVDRDMQKLRVLVDYTWERQVTELDAKVRDGKRKLEAARKTAEAEERKAMAAIEIAKSGLKILRDQLDEHKKLREKCTLYAEQDGTVAYANERYWDPSDRIREGTELYSGRNVYYLPDTTRMQVKVNVHESVVDRIKPSQQAVIRLDAFSDRKLSGTVKSVSGMAASSYSNVQNYDTIVVIDGLPADLAIKPGMTAEVDILVGVLEDVLAVPVGAVTEHFSQTYVYLMNGNKAERRIVKTDRMTHSFIEVTEGLKEGDVVALDAYQRGLVDFADTERDVLGGDSIAPDKAATGGGP